MHRKDPRAQLLIVLVLAHAGIVVLVPHEPRILVGIGVLFGLEILAVWTLLSVLIRVAPVPTDRPPSPTESLRAACTELRREVEVLGAGTHRVGRRLEQGSRFLEAFAQRLEQEEDGIGLLTSASEVARSAALNVQVVSRRLAQPPPELDLLAQEMEVLAHTLEEMAEQRRIRTREERQEVESLRDQLGTDRSEAREDLAGQDRVGDLLARIEDRVLALAEAERPGDRPENP